MFGQAEHAIRPTSASVTPWEPTINLHSHLIRRSVCVYQRERESLYHTHLQLCPFSLVARLSFHFKALGYFRGYYCSWGSVWTHQYTHVVRIAQCQLLSACTATEKLWLDIYFLSASHHSFTQNKMCVCCSHSKWEGDSRGNHNLHLSFSLLFFFVATWSC